jgi:hypothetical protein
MDMETLLNPVLWIVIALLIGMWKAGSWVQRIHEENVRDKARAKKERDGLP